LKEAQQKSNRNEVEYEYDEDEIYWDEGPASPTKKK
jgi:hypothetical protein